MKASIEIKKETMDRLSCALDYPPLYDEDGSIDEKTLSDAIELMVQLCAD